MSFLSHFTHQYKLSKTLRFELKPCDQSGIPITGAVTLDDYKNIFLSKVVEEDSVRDTDYKVVKEVINDYHRQHIEKALTPNYIDSGQPILNSGTKLKMTSEDFVAAFALYQILAQQKDDASKRYWEDAQGELRKKIASALTADKTLFDAKLIKEVLPKYLEKLGAEASTLDAVKSFKAFAGYFSGFHTNRKNMYVDKAQATAIPYRLINDNLSKHFQNISIHQRLLNDHAELARILDDTLGRADLFTPEVYITLLTQAQITYYNRQLADAKVVVNRYELDLKGALSDAKKREDEAAVTSINTEIRSLKRYKFVPLFKQILSENTSDSYVPDGFDSDKDLLSAVKSYVEKVFPQACNDMNQVLRALFLNANVNLDRIYLKTDKLADLSLTLYGNRHVLVKAHETLAEKEEPTMNGRLTENVQKKRKSFMARPVSVEKLQDEVEECRLRELEDNQDNKLLKSSDTLSDRLSELGQYVDKSRLRLDERDRTCIDKRLALSKQLLDGDVTEIDQDRRLPSESKDKQNGGKGYQQIALIKEVMDDCMAHLHGYAHLHLVKNRKPIDIPDADPAFYADYNAIIDGDDTIEGFLLPTINLYNKCRNYLSKKPYSKEKVKINFAKAVFLDGFTESKTDKSDNGTQYQGYLFRKTRPDGSYNYYLGAGEGTSKSAKLFRAGGEVSHEDQSDFERLNYYQAKSNSIYGSSYPGVYKDDKQLFANEVFNALPSGNAIQSAYDKLSTTAQTPAALLKLIESEASDCLPDLQDSTQFNNAHTSIIERIKQSLLNYQGKSPKLYALSQEDWSDIRSLQHAIDNAVLEKSFLYSHISQGELDEAISTGTLFLFQIYNKDFSENKRNKDSSKNLHTLYFEALMSGVGGVFDLGKGEVFFRPKSLDYDKQRKHDGNEAVENKQKEFHGNETSLFPYKIVKDKRFTKDKFFLHLSTIWNYTQLNKPFKFNQAINTQLVESPESLIIGIDRGERNLLTYSVIDQGGKIIDQGDFNKIKTDKGYAIDYHKKLSNKEKQRDQARKSWGEIENIKELKSGYLSYVVHQLALLIEEHDAIVCLEDLNFGFKRGRFKVEKQVYQKFEKALIDKLNYLVFKDKDVGEAGHHLNAYQLTAPFESFQKLGKQTGILYYVTAAYTSKICPATGFVNFLDLRYKSLGRAIEFFERIDSFSYNEQAKRYELSFNYNKMESLAPRATEKGRQQWTLGTHGDLRYRNEKRNNHWVPVEVNSTDEIAKILEEEAGIIAMPGENIAPQLIALKDNGFKNMSGLFKRLLKAFNTAFSLRQSKTGTDTDFILSPVVLKDGSYFDSQTSKMKLPSNADENGGYHIALKGLWTLEQMRQNEKYRNKLPTLSNNDWIPFAQRIATAKGAGMANP